MRKFLLLLLFLVFAIGFVGDSDAAPRRRETIQITTYYPAPYGAYHKLETDFLKIHPQDNSVEDPAAPATVHIPCNASNLGQIYHFDGTDVIASASVDSTLRICARIFDGTSYDYEWADLGTGSGEQDFVMDPATSSTGLATYQPYPNRLKFNPDVADYSSTVSDNVFFNKDLSGEAISIKTRDRKRRRLDPSTGLITDMCSDGSPVDNSQGAGRCYPTAFTVDKFANIGTGNNAFASPRVGVGTDSPATILDIRGDIDPNSSNANDLSGNRIPAVMVNGQAIIQVFRVMHDPVNGVNLRPTAPAQVADHDLRVPMDDFFCTVGGKMSKYIPKHISNDVANNTGTDEYEGAWVYEDRTRGSHIGTDTWHLRVADPFDPANTANNDSRYRPRVEVICYPREMVSYHLIPANPGTSTNPNRPEDYAI